MLGVAFKLEAWPSKVMSAAARATRRLGAAERPSRMAPLLAFSVFAARRGSMMRTVAHQSTQCVVLSLGRPEELLRSKLSPLELAIFRRAKPSAWPPLHPGHLDPGTEGAVFVRTLNDQSRAEVPPCIRRVISQIGVNFLNDFAGGLAAGPILRIRSNR